MVQAFVIVLQCCGALFLSRIIIRRCVDDVAGENLLPEGEASGGTWDAASVELITDRETQQPLGHKNELTSVQAISGRHFEPHEVQEKQLREGLMVNCYQTRIVK